jgi:hypothetical protein
MVNALPKVAAVGAIAAAFVGKVVLASAADTGVISTLIQDVGLPVAMLLVLAMYHARVVREKSKMTRQLLAQKDAEIKRLNDARVRMAIECQEKVTGLLVSTTELAKEAHSTLDSLRPVRHEETTP